MPNNFMECSHKLLVNTDKTTRKLKKITKKIVI